LSTTDRTGRDPTTTTRLAVALGLVLVVATAAAVVDDERPRLAATNSKVNVSGVALTIGAGEERCQGGEYIPEETTRLRMYVGGFGPAGGPPLEVWALYADGREATRTRLDAGYRPGPVDVPVPSPADDVAGGVLCIRNQGSEAMGFAGNLTPLGADAQLGPNSPGARPTDEVRVDYYRPGQESWMEIAPEIASRFELFKAGFVGAWTMWAALATVGVLWVVVVTLLVRSQPQTPDAEDEQRRRFPRVGWVCAGVAVVNAAVWAVVTPSFQVPDEPIHVGYAQWLAESGKLPRVDVALREDALFAEDYQAVLEAMPFSIEGKPSWSEPQEEDLRRKLEENLSRRAETGAWTAANYPPLYYAVTAVPARLGSGLSPLDRLFLLRLVSALLTGLTVLCVFAFLRELLPATPWAWTVGALVVAFHPVLGFIGGGVNNDNLLYAAGALLLALLARAFRRGLTVRLGLAVGATLIAGVLTKPAMFGLVPGAAIGLLVLAVRGHRGGDREAVRGALAAGILFVAVTTTWYVIDAVMFGRTPMDATGGLVEGSAPTSFLSQLSYLWQFYLPKLPFMGEKFPGYPRYPVWDVFIQGFVGRFGYFQYGFPMWAYRLGFVILLGIAALAVVELGRRRQAVRRRWAELLCYAAMVAGLAVLLGVTGYRYRATYGANFEQTRYLFPLLGLYGAVVALAARGVGRRWSRPVGSFLVVLAMGHSLLAMMLTVARYYA